MEQAHAEQMMNDQKKNSAEARLISSATRGTKMKRLLWVGVEWTLFRGSFHTMYGWRSFLLRAFGARMGKKCRIRRTAHFYYPWNVEFGDEVIVGDHANLYSLGRIKVGNRATISQESYLCAGTHDHTQLALPLVVKPIEIGAEAWVCARAFVGPGITVGEGAVVAACGVVVKDVEPWTIVGGNPAKFLKKRVIIGGSDQ